MSSRSTPERSGVSRVGETTDWQCKGCLQLPAVGVLESEWRSNGVMKELKGRTSCPLTGSEERVKLLWSGVSKWIQKIQMAGLHCHLPLHVNLRKRWSYC
jgi:hypothetical protein